MQNDMVKYMIYGAVAVFGVFYYFKIQNKKKKLADSLPREKLPYLTVGAIYLRGHARSERFLGSVLGKGEIKTMLKRDWGIKTRQDAINVIEAAINGNIHAITYDQQLDDYKASKNFTNNAEMLVKFYRNDEVFTLEQFQHCQTTLAWDLERAAQVTRYTYEIGLIAENEAWDYLSKILKIAKEHFNTWHDYAISFLLGRCMWRGNKMDSSILQAISYLLLNANPQDISIWREFPLHS